MNTILIIGAGGITSYLLPLLVRTAREARIVLADGDILEKRNLDRQQFTSNMVGRNKAEALRQTYPKNCVAIPEYLTDPYQAKTLFEDKVPRGSTPKAIFCCADNNLPRVTSLELATLLETPVFILANETYSWDTYAYSPKWKRDPDLHPLEVFPEWGTKDGLDPSIPCTSEEAIIASGGQLPIANASAALYGMRLFTNWNEFPERSELLTECPNRPFYYHGNGIHTTYKSINTI